MGAFRQKGRVRTVVRLIRRHDGVAGREHAGPTVLVAHKSVSVIVPTRNEEQNVATLVQRTTAALHQVDVRSEIIFVDDSDDETPRAIRAEHGNDIPVRMVHRTRAQRRDGVPGAVLRGFTEARGSVLVVMDGDLQHPPEILPRLLAPVIRGDAQLAVATRYGRGGCIEGADGRTRRAVSAATRHIVHTLVRRSRPVSDPLGGFFVVERSVVDDVELRSDSSRILLEILERGRWSRGHEVPYTFGPRRHGRSKSTKRDALRFAAYLARVGTVPGSDVLRSSMFRVFLTVGLLALAYGHSLRTLVGGWSPSDAATASCIVPILAVPLFLRCARPTDRGSAIRDRHLDDGRVLTLLAVALFVLWTFQRHVDVAFGIHRVDLLSLPCFLAGLVVMLFGTSALWRLRIPLLFLLLAWPPALNAVAHATSAPMGDATRAVVRPIAAWVGDIVVDVNGFTVATQTIRVAPGWNATAVALVVAIGALVVSLVQLQGVARRAAFIVYAATVAWLVNLGLVVCAIFAANVGATGVAQSAIGASAVVVASIVALGIAVLALPHFARGHLRPFGFRSEVACAPEARFTLFR
jgi:Glycosyl transferase family 2/Transmembrane exosortase (Exosortase_EpsH)